MNSSMAKEASANRIISKSVKELTKNLSNSGVAIKGGVGGAVKQVTKTDFGLAGMAGEAVKNGAKTVAKKTTKALPQTAQNKINQAVGKTRPATEAISKARTKFDNAVADIDMKGGAIGHKLAPGKSKELFVQKRQFEIDPKNANSNKQFLEHESTSLSEPLKKARNVAVPIAGGMYFNDKLEKMKYNPAQEANSEKNAQETREQVIDKVACIIQNDSRAYLKQVDNTQVNRQTEKMVKLASEASSMLKQASENQILMMEKIASLQEENEKLKMSIKQRDVTDRSEKLANEMLDKGLIKVAEYEGKKTELTNMDDSSFEMLVSIVEGLETQKTASETGVDSLMYIAGDVTIKEKKTMLDSFL